MHIIQFIYTHPSLYTHTPPFKKKKETKHLFYHCPPGNKGKEQGRFFIDSISTFFMYLESCKGLHSK